jgi:ATP-dependent Lon protease
MGLNNEDIVINDDTIREIIDKYTYEGGVRKLKSTLYSICRELNLANLVKDSIKGVKVKFPFTVEAHHVKLLLKHKIEIDHDKIHSDDKPGVVNGLWANSLGNGGVLSIETMLVPSSSFLAIKATGHLEKVIKESTEVATSLAWSYLPEDIKSKYLAESKDKPLGIHIHCPDGATPKDGPSAGAALTIALYSLLTGKKIKHDIAMTGEINLEGKVTAIGGLEEKLEGAKRAGVKLVLFPKENVKHLDKIKERNLTLLDNNFKVIPIESFEEVIKYSIV